VIDFDVKAFWEFLFVAGCEEISQRISIRKIRHRKELDELGRNRVNQINPLCLDLNIKGSAGEGHAARLAYVAKLLNGTGWRPSRKTVYTHPGSLPV